MLYLSTLSMFSVQKQSNRAEAKKASERVREREKETEMMMN